MHQANQEVGNLGILRRQTWLLAITGDADTEGITRPGLNEPLAAQSLVVEMASPLFGHHLLDDFGFETFLAVHLLEPTVFLFKLAQPSHQ